MAFVFIETKGRALGKTSLELMLKSSRVTFAGAYQIGDGFFTVAVQGESGDVRTAAEAVRNTYGESDRLLAVYETLNPSDNLLNAVEAFKI